MVLLEDPWFKYSNEKNIKHEKKEVLGKDEISRTQPIFWVKIKHFDKNAL